MQVVVLAIAFIGLVLVFLIPRQMLLLFWLILLLYPTRLLHGMLPLNAGLDDLFLMAVGLRIVLLPGGGGRPKANAVIWLAIALVGMETMANLTGLVRYPALWTFAVRDALKGVGYVVFAAAMAESIRTDKDVRKHLAAFLIAVSLSFLVVVLCYVEPYFNQFWEYVPERKERPELLGLALRRGWGPYHSEGSLGVELCAVVPLALGILWHKIGRHLLKFLAVCVLVTGAAALIICKTRATVLGLAGMFIVMALFSRKRVWVIALMIVGILAGAYMFSRGSELLQAVQARLTIERIRADVAIRADRCWWPTITNPSPAIVFFAEGGAAMGTRLKASPHNGYLGALFQWGLGGVIVFCIVIRCLLKWSRSVLKHDRDRTARAFAWGLLWGSLAIAILAMTSDPWYATPYRFSLYFMLVVVNLRYMALMRERQTYQQSDQYGIQVGQAETYEEMLANWASQTHGTAR